MQSNNRAGRALLAIGAVFAAVMLALTCAVPGTAAVPLGGLTVAVSPSGDKLVAGGDSRTLLVLDPNSLAVKDRIWIETTIVDLSFDKGGGTLAITDTSGSILLYDTASWKRRAEIQKRGSVAYAPLAGLIASTNGSNRDEVLIHSMADGKEVKKIELPKGANVLGVGLSADGKKVAVLLRSKNGDEQKVANNAIPKDLKGIEREEFILKNDGKVSEFLVYDTASGKLAVQKTTFYSADNTSTLLFDGDTVVAVNYRNLNARFAPDGSIKLFNAENSYNYGIGVSPDQKAILSGGLRSYSITKPDGSTAAKGELPKLPGWPEYFKGFSATADGKTIYGATTGYRVVKLGADGKIIAVEPLK